MLVQRLFIVACILTLLIPQQSLAQGGNSAGISLSPATVEKGAEPGETIQEQVTITNLSSSRQTYYLFTRDITGVQGSGVPVFARDNQEKTGYELTEWVTLSTTEVTLAPSEQQRFDVTIAVPENATPGSHFGAVFASIEPPRMRSVGAAVAYEVANIISIRVAGDVDDRATIRQFSTDNYIYGSPIVEFNARVENEGNVLVRPVGPLEIYDMFGRKVAQLTFNESQAGVFPKSQRDFNITWEDQGPGFGRYEAILALNYGQAGAYNTMSSTVNFWVLPTSIIYPALGILAFLLLASYVGIKLYVRSKTRAYGMRRTVRRQQSAMPLTLLLLIVMLSVTALFLIVLLLLFA